MVYFLQDMRRDRIKIGYVDVMSVENRVHQIRLNNRGLIRLLATIEGKREPERELHQQFQKSRVLINTRYGDWFRMSDDLCCFVSSLNSKLRLLSDSGKRWQAGTVMSSMSS